MISPENGKMKIETLILKLTSGAKRIWKLKSLNQKEAVFEIRKFG